MIERNADVNRSTNIGISPLILACRNADLDTFNELISCKQHIEINHADIYGSTALFNASKVGNTYIVKKLIECKADVNISMRAPDKPIFRAKQLGETELCYESIKNNTSCVTPLQMACFLGHTTLVGEQIY